MQSLKARAADNSTDLRRTASRRFSSLADMDAILSGAVSDVDFKLDDADIELAIKVALTHPCMHTLAVLQVFVYWSQC